MVIKMKRSFNKRALIGVLAAVIALAGLSVTVLISGAAGTYKVYADIPGTDGGSQLVNQTNGVTIWAGGGKSSVDLGDGFVSSVDLKNLQLNLFMAQSGSTKFYNITASKNVGWVIGKEPGVMPVDTSGTKPKLLKSTVANVSKGKVTAGKVTAENGGVETVYAIAYVIPGDKTVTMDKYEVIASVKVTVMQAATAIELYDKKNVNYAEDKKITALNVNIGDEIAVYPVPNAGKNKDKTPVEPNSASTYTVKVTPEKDGVTYLAKIKNPGGAETDKLTFTQTEFAQGFTVVAKEISLDAKNRGEGGDASKINDKAGKAVISITNDQSGKTLKLTVNITNTPAVNTSNTLNVKIGDTGVPAKKGSKETFDLIAANALKLPGSALNPTRTLTKPSVAFYSKNDGLNVSDMVVNGKLKLPTANKASEYKASLDNTNSKITVELTKDVTLPVGSAATTTIYAVVAYGSTVNSMGALPQILVFPITVTLPVAAGQ